MVKMLVKKKPAANFGKTQRQVLDQCEWATRLCLYIYDSVDSSSQLMCGSCEFSYGGIPDGDNIFFCFFCLWSYYQGRKCSRKAELKMTIPGDRLKSYGFVGH